MASRKRLNSGADDGPPNKTSHQPSVLIAQSAQPPQQTRAPPKQLNSDIEMNLVKQRLKKMETEWADRGKQLSHKQAEINCLKKQMDAMRADYEDKITKLTTLLRFEKEEDNANCLRNQLTVTSNVKDVASSRQDLRNRHVEHQSTTRSTLGVLSNRPMNVPFGEPEESTDIKRTKDLMLNLFLRRISVGFSGKNVIGGVKAQYKVEADELPCSLIPGELMGRFNKIRNLRRDHPAQCTAFEDARIPSRQQVLNPKIFESDDRSDRVSIWTALHVNDEKFLYRDPIRHQKLQKMQLLGKNMEYNSILAENRNNFEKLDAPNYTVPQWFSRFYV